MNEFDFIRRLREQMRSRERSPRLTVGIGDDAAVFKQASDRDLVITTDLLVEGIDFHAHATSPRLLGHKALAVSLSDVAAMGARPRWALVSAGFPEKVWATTFKSELFDGYLALADRYGVTLAGGDVSRSPQILIDSIVVGEVSAGRAVLRSTARPGDQIFVTGALGGAAAGLKLIELGARVSSVSEPRADRGPHAGSPRGVVVATGSSDNRAASADGSLVTPSEPHGESGSDQSADDSAIQALLLRQLSPEPRVGWGIVLREEQLATSMIDISDGLSSDLNHVCEESSVGALIAAASLPLDQDVVQLCGRRALDPLALALHGGEDFELLFTVAPQNISRLPKRVDGVAISRIGEIEDAGKLVRVKEQNRIWELSPQGFMHFGS